MPTIKPVSDLRNYPEVLQDVHEGSPVFLTKNGRGSYVVLDMADYDRMCAERTLVAELERGRLSGETDGWLTTDDVKQHLIDGKNKENDVCEG